MDAYESKMNPVVYGTGAEARSGQWEATKQRAFSLFSEDTSIAKLKYDIYNKELTKAKEYADKIGYDYSGHLEEIKRWDGPTIYDKSYGYNLDNMSRVLKERSVELGDGEYTKTYQEEIDARNEDLAIRRAKAQSLVERAPSPLMAELGGSMMAMLADPVDIAAGLLTGGTVTVATKLNMLRKAAVVGGTVGLAEAGKQAIVVRNKKEINSPYGVKEALINVAGATLGVGALDFVGTYGSSKLLKYLAKETDDVLGSPQAGTKEALESIRANEALARDIKSGQRLEGKHSSPVDHLQRSDNMAKAVDEADVRFEVAEDIRTKEMDEDLDTVFDSIIETDEGLKVKEYVDKIDSDADMYKKMLQECYG